MNIDLPKPLEDLIKKYAQAENMTVSDYIINLLMNKIKSDSDLLV